MKSFDSQDDLTANTVPELIKHLWELYMSMSLDPALAPSADHIRQAALVLESTRRMALEVTIEAQSRRAKPSKRKSKSAGERQTELEWQMAAGQHRRQSIKSGAHIHTAEPRGEVPEMAFLQAITL